MSRPNDAPDVNAERSSLLVSPSERHQISAHLRAITQRTHRKHLLGWLAYAFASEVFAVVSLTLFLPICLEQFARDNGYLSPDFTVPCANQPSTPDEETRCAVRFGWFWIDTASFSLYVFSASVALQALTVISVGAIADQPSQRKPLLLTFAAIGSISTSAFLLLTSTSPIWVVCALLAILGNVSFGTSVVAMNAYLPDLAKADPEVREAWDEVEVANELYAESQTFPHATSEVDLPNTPLIAPPSYNSIADGDPQPAHKAALAHYNKLLSLTTSRLSAQGIALGYGAGIILLLGTLVPVVLLKGSTLALRIAIGLSGFWWAIFTIPAALWLPAARGGLAPEFAKAEERVTLWTEVKRSWWRLGQMFRPAEILKLRNTFWYLAAWFLLSDGFTTITSTAVLFAKTTLHLPASALVGVGVLTPVAGIAGSLVWPRIQRAAGWSNIRVVLALVLLASLIPLYGCIGFFTRTHGGDEEVPDKFRFGGLTTKAEMFTLAIYFGSIYGAFQGFSRALYSEMIPRGEEARWFSLYSITDKSSSFVGPLCVGLIADATGNIRYGFFFLVFMMWFSVPVLLTVNVERGRDDAKVFSEQREQAARETDM